MEPNYTEIYRLANGRWGWNVEFDVPGESKSGEEDTRPKAAAAVEAAIVEAA